MTAGVQKQTAHEWRKGESVCFSITSALVSASNSKQLSYQALSELADLVERQQAHRTFPRHTHATEPIEEHMELDILDNLNPSDNSTQIRLKDLLLDTNEGCRIQPQRTHRCGPKTAT